MKPQALLLLLLLSLADGSPIWKVFCSGGPVYRGRIDPIVNPGKISGHSHRVAGGSHFSAAQTTSTPLSVYNEMIASPCTTCSISQVDLSAYWHPDLYYMWPNGSFSLVPNSGLTVYYLSRTGDGAQANPDWKPFPKGLRMLAGNPYRRNFSGSVEDQAINYVCLTAAGAPSPNGEPNGFPTDRFFCTNGLRAQIFFPMCWDGVNLDSANHKSHMAYPTRPNGGNCPATHPVRVPGIFFEALYSVDKFPHGQGTNPFVWSCGDPTGYGLHGDFLSGWDEEVVRRALADPACDNNNPDMAFGNNVKACPPLAPYVQSVPAAGVCSLASPIKLTEDLGIGHTIPALPGCNPITYGPQDAVPCSALPTDTPSLGVDKRFFLKSRLNGKFVTAPNNSSANIAAILTVPETLNEVFDPIPIDATQVAIMNENSGNYLSANGENGRLKANRGTASDWEYFVIEPRGTNLVAIISKRNNQYVTVLADSTLAPTSLSVAGDAQLFELSTPNGGMVESVAFTTDYTRSAVSLPTSARASGGASGDGSNTEAYDSSAGAFALAQAFIATALWCAM